jgi:hypothetical protein
MARHDGCVHRIDVRDNYQKGMTTMSIDIQPGSPGVSGRTRDPITVLAGGSFAQAAAAGAAAVLAIIGLAGTLTDYMMSIATIALGAAFLLQPGGIASQYLGLAARGRGDFVPPVGGGLTAASIAGVTAVALGILALVDVEPYDLIPAAIIALSGGLILDSATSVDSTAYSYEQRMEERVVGGPRSMVNGGDLLVGIGGATLGILALIGISTVTLSLVALLALGVSNFLNGSTIGARLMRSSR